MYLCGISIAWQLQAASCIFYPQNIENLYPEIQLDEMTPIWNAISIISLHQFCSVDEDQGLI